MPPARRCKSSKSGERQEVLRKSPRKRNIPKAIEEPVKTPKRTSRKKAVKLDKSLSKTPPFPDYFNTPSTSSGSNSKKVCSFYRVKSGDESNREKSPTFSKSLIKYFMKVDSPGMEDLKLKRFNSSFRYERPTNRDSLKIFTEEEDDDKKYLENVCVCVPKLNFDMPDIPGTEYAKVFESIPLTSADSDEELKPQVGVKRRKSIRCTEFKGKPLPEECLAVDYSAVLDSESSHDDAESGYEEKEVLHGASSDNKSSILLSLLSSPSNGLSTPYHNSNLQPSYGYNISRTKEDEMLLSKYKDIMNNKQVNVVLTRLPIVSLLQLYDKKELNAKPTTDFQGEKKVSKVKGRSADKKVKAPRQGLSKPQKKKRNTKP